MAFSLFTFIVWKTFFFMLFNPYFFIFQIYLHIYLFLLNIYELLVIFQPHNLKGNNDRLIHVILSYKLFHHFHDNGCNSITMFLDCALNYAFNSFLHFCYLMTLLRYLGAGAGAGTGAGAGAGAGK